SSNWSNAACSVGQSSLCFDNACETRYDPLQYLLPSPLTNSRIYVQTKDYAVHKAKRRENYMMVAVLAKALVMLCAGSVNTFKQFMRFSTCCSLSHCH